MKDGWILDAAELKGRPLPEWAQDVPELELVDNIYLSAFWDLTTERKYEMGPIPNSSILDFCKDREFDQIVTMIFNAIIRALDKVYLEWVAGERDKSMNKPEPKINVTKPKGA